MSDLLKKNPWKDIAPYTTSDAANFKGREEDIRKFSRILHQNDFSVLYAESGIGKTSFINAGIMPAFIDTDYYFVRVEFPLEVLSPTDKVTNEELASNLESWLCNKIFPEVISEDNKIKGELFQDLIEVASNAHELKHNLWWKLHAYKYMVEGRTVKPFIVFDQFEEVFQKANPIVLNELFSILDSLSSRIPPRVVLDRLYEFEEKGIYVSLDASLNFKVLFSLRKEYLAEFDYWINDVYSNSQLLQSRMILLPFTKEQAEEVITQQKIDGEPVNTLVDVKDDILALFEHRYVHPTMNARNKNSYEAFLLSVICSRLYVIAQSIHKNRLEKEDIANINLHKLILNFYNESIGDSIPKRHLKIIEEELVDNFGERNRIKVTTEKLSSIHFQEQYLDGLKKKHIVKSSDGYVELIHDRVAEAIYQKRKDDNKKQWFLLQRIILSCIILFFTGVSLKYAWSTSVETTYQSREFIRKEWKTPVDYNLVITDPYVESVIIENKKISNSYISNCPNLTNVKIENRKSSLGLSISNCPKLHSLSLSESITQLEGSISECPDLHCFRLPRHIKSISSRLFRDLDSLEIEVPESAKNTFRWENKILWDIKSEKIVYAQTNADSVVLFPKELEHLDCLKYNYSRVFRNAKDEKPKIEIVGTTIVNVNLYNNDTIDLSDTIYNGIKSIGNKAFYNARNLIEIKLPLHLRNINDEAFAGCTSLQRIEFPDSLARIGNEAFAGCTNLREIKLPNVLRDLGTYAFSGCSRLKKLHLPDNLDLYKDDNDKNHRNGVYTQFEGCDSLTHISFTEKSPFKEKNEIIFKNGEPFLFIGSHLNYNDSSLYTKNGVLTYSYKINNIKYSQDIHVANGKHHIAYLYYKGNKIIVNPIIYYPDSIEYLPLFRENVTFIGSHKLRELHIANVSPRNFEILMPDIVKSKITLYVPYGCKKYFDTPEFSTFKEIKEDSFYLRVKNILLEMISNTLGQSYVLYYILSFITLVVFILIYVFYRKKYLIKYSKANISKEVFYGKPLLMACSTLFVFLLTWMSVYWSIFFVFEGYRAMIFGHLFGIIVALFSTWMLVFVRNADIWMTIKSEFNHLIVRSRTITFVEIMQLFLLGTRKILFVIFRFVKTWYRVFVSVLLVSIIIGVISHKRSLWSEAIYSAESILSEDLNDETIRKAEALLYNSMPRWKFLLSKEQQDELRVIYEKMFDTVPNYKVLNELSEKGHNSSISSAVFSHNDSLVVTSNYSNTIIWNVLTGDTICKLRGGRTLAFSHNDSLVVTGSYGNTIIWNVLTGDTICKLRGCRTLAFSHNDSLVITDSGDNTAIIWDVLTGDSIRTLRGHKYGINSVAFSHNDSLVITGSGDNTAIIWDALTGDSIRTLRGHKHRINSVAFSHNDSLVVTGSDDDTAIVWDVLTGDSIRVLQGRSNINSVAFSHNDSLVLAKEVSWKIHSAIIWNALSGETIQTMSFNDEDIIRVSFNSDASKTFIATDKNIYVDDGKNSVKIISVLNHFFNGYRVTVVDSENNPNAYISNNGTALVWNTLTGKILHSSNQKSYATYSPDGKYMASGSGKRSPEIYDFSIGNTIPIKGEHKKDIESILFSHKGDYLVTGSSDGTAIIWSTTSGDSLYTLRGHKDKIKTLAFSYDDKFLITASEDKKAIVWNLLSCDSICTWKSDSDIDIASFTSGDKNIILGASGMKMYKLSNWRAGDSYRVSDYGLSYKRLAFSSDCKYAVTSNGDVFDVDTEKLLYHIECKDADYIYFSSSDDEYYLVSDTSIKKVKLLTLNDWTKKCHQTLSEGNIGISQK